MVHVGKYTGPVPWIVCLGTYHRCWGSTKNTAPTEATFVVRFLPRGGHDLVQALATNRLTCQQRPSPRPLR